MAILLVVEPQISWECEAVKFINRYPILADAYVKLPAMTGPKSSGALAEDLSKGKVRPGLYERGRINDEGGRCRRRGNHANEISGS